MTFATRQRILEETSTKTAEVKHRHSDVYHIPGPKPPLPPEVKLRQYLVGIRDFEPDRYEGYGLDPEQVVREITDRFAKFDEVTDPIDFCVWEGNLVVAVVHSRGDRSGNVALIDWQDPEAAKPEPETRLTHDGYAQIREDVSNFDKARSLGDRSFSSPHFNKLGRTLAAAGYAGVAWRGQLYLSSVLLPELGTVDNEYGCEVFRSDLVLDLDGVVTLDKPEAIPVAKPRFDRATAWRVTSGDNLLYLTRRSETTLDEILADQMVGMHTEDVAIWDGSELAAVIQAGDDGKPVSTVLLRKTDG